MVTCESLFCDQPATHTVDEDPFVCEEIIDRDDGMEFCDDCFEIRREDV